MKSSIPGRGSDQFALRLPDGLRDRIKERAKTRGRSMNTEIADALDRAFPRPSQMVDAVETLAGVIHGLDEHLSYDEKEVIAKEIRTAADSYFKTFEETSIQQGAILKKERKDRKKLN